MRSRLAIAAAFASSAIVSMASSARADDTAAGRATAARQMDRPHTLAEVNTGFITLPGALVCPLSGATESCKRGEFSFAAGLQNVYRYHAFGFGAGIQWATTLRSDAANGDPSLMREHSRRYFLVEGLFRYYFLRSKSWEFWTGVTFGGVVVNDSWSVDADRNPYSDAALPGPRAATLGTEGLTVGAGIGAEWSFAANWSFGPSLRYSNWFLPNKRLMSPTLDVASLSGRLDMLDVGIRLAYRIAL